MHSLPIKIPADTQLLQWLGDPRCTTSNAVGASLGRSYRDNGPCRCSSQSAECTLALPTNQSRPTRPKFYERHNRTPHQAISMFVTVLATRLQLLLWDSFWSFQDASPEPRYFLLSTSAQHISTLMSGVNVICNHIFVT